MLTAVVHRDRKRVIVLSGLSILLALVFLFSLTIGAVHISVTQGLSILLDSIGLSFEEVTTVQEKVFLNIRLPRLVQTVIIGGALGLCGAVLQGLFRNPLVEPGLVGVSSGAALAAVLFIVFGVRFTSQIPHYLQNFLLPICAFVGGLLATMAVYKLSQSVGRTHIALLILAGVAIIMLTQAFIGLSVFYADENQARAYTFWTLGDLGGATWEKLFITVPLVIIPCVVLLRFTRPLNAMAAGEAEAFHMGVNVERMKVSIIVCCALAVGTVVSLSGTIGFVGLVIPHMIRMSFGADHRLILPASVLGGAILLIVSDIFARTIVKPAELPIGIVTAMIGAPFLIYLLRTAKRNHQI